ncbi:MAG TPA: hypothetical protein VHY37_00885 [Tepidisphaeraceae bacterium]|nr:hypothetical protein [Tepidisphaeraceae bacterium]
MLEKLDNNEAVLLMYLAEELPTEDRAEIERMLAGDESLRGQLASVRLAQEATERTLRALDAASPRGARSGLESGSAGEAAAIRRIHRSMHSHLLRKLAERPAAPAAKRGLRYPWWCYPTAAIAASVLAFLVWWGNNANGPQTIPPYHVAGSQRFVDQAPSPKVKALNQFWGPSDDTAQVQQQDQIAEGVRQLAALSSGGDDEAAVWNIGSGSAGGTGDGAGESHE